MNHRAWGHLTENYALAAREDGDMMANRAVARPTGVSSTATGRESEQRRPGIGARGTVGLCTRRAQTSKEVNALICSRRGCLTTSSVFDCECWECFVDHRTRWRSHHCGQTGTADVPFEAHQRPGNGARAGARTETKHRENPVRLVCVWLYHCRILPSARKLATAEERTSRPSQAALRYTNLIGSLCTAFDICRMD